MNIRQTIDAAAEDLRGRGFATPRLDGEILLAHCLGGTRAALYAWPERILTEAEAEAFASLVSRRRQGEPVAYILGEKEFWSLPFAVDRRVLIPRPETEVLVEEALALLPAGAAPHLRVLDIGTGSGILAVVLAKERPDMQVVATDVSGEALAVARANARRHGVEGQIRFVRADLFPGGDDLFDLVVSNPPYVAETDVPLLPFGVRGFEPSLALLAGPDGTLFHGRVAREGRFRLRPGGWLAMEIGAGQGARVRDILASNGYEVQAIRKDYAGFDRVITAGNKAAP